MPKGSGPKGTWPTPGIMPGGNRPGTAPGRVLGAGGCSCIGGNGGKEFIGSGLGININGMWYGATDGRALGSGTGGGLGGSGGGWRWHKPSAGRGLWLRHTTGLATVLKL